MEDKKMKYALDRIEEDIAILENIKTGEKRKISIFNLPQNIHEGTILKKENNTYLIDTKEEEKRRKLIEDKFKKLRGN